MLECVPCRSSCGFLLTQRGRRALGQSKKESKRPIVIVRPEHAAQVGAQCEGARTNIVVTVAVKTLTSERAASRRDARPSTTNTP